MSNFRTRILGLAAMATAFVGMSYGQVVICGSGTNVPAGATAPTAYSGTQAAGTAAGISNLGTQVNPSLRAEAQTELIAVFQFNCTIVNAGPPAAPAPPPGGTTATTGTIYITTNLPITSKALPPASNEATAILNGTTTVVGPNGQTTLGNGTAVPGVVSGNQVTFALGAATIPVYPAVVTVEITNLRVNASTAGAPQVTESGLLSYVVPNTTSGLVTANLALPTANGPGYVLKSLGAPTFTAFSIAPGATFTVCGGNSVFAAAPSFAVNINQLIPDPFLGPGLVGSNANTTVSLLPGSEVGQYVTAGGAGTASADIINLVVANLPASATVYAPQTLGPFPAGGGGGNNFSLTIASSTVATTPAGAAVGGLVAPVAFTPTGGTVTSPYPVTIPALSLGALTVQTPSVPVLITFAANSAVAQGPITVNYGYAPAVAALTGPATSVPQFITPTFTALNAQAIVNCQTTLLFPFVTNQVGFDTGIAISNTSTDNLGFGGKSFAAAQAGTCNLFFYGPTAPSPATVADPQGNLPTGNTHAFTLSSVAAGYQGYMIAVCPFQYAHAFAFLTYGLTTANGVAEGYLAPVLGSRASTTYGDAVTTF